MNLSKKWVDRGVPKTKYENFIFLFHVVTNIKKFAYKATKNQGQSTYADGLTKVVIGALALGLGELLGSGSATLFGSDQTSGMGELGL
ncbi:hypothetical protein [uncultured Bilophila sp.]|uniref:hypothetical protein n=1 Tax=uncultured Bilophila sp. TaxID=529385 RepID=UPI00266F80A0|nr:hypothetical protein [uncultured Bilophila sp.]